MSVKELKNGTEKLEKHSGSLRILRFRRSERLVHWAIAIPFLTCFATALVLVFFYNPDPLRPYRNVFSWIHRISGISLLVFPILSMFKSRGDYRVYFHNIKQAWLWTAEDIKWLFLMGLAAVSSRFTLPEQGKFNAAEKLNFMTLMSTYPLYILTGAFIWLTQGALLSWFIHFGMALIAAPLLFGHLFMAMINPGTRAGLSGMISGFVDRHWAKHHYAKWYRENFENAPVLAEVSCEIIHPVRENYFNNDTGEPVLQPVEVVDAAEFKNEHETATMQ